MSIGPSGVGGVGLFGCLVAGPGAPPNEEWPDAYNVSSQSVDATVADSTTAPQIEAGRPYTQPNTGAPAANAGVSVAGVAPPPNQIEASPGNYTQENTNAPTANPQIGQPTFRGNPMGL
jgi:hypothetical protein